MLNGISLRWMHHRQAAFASLRELLERPMANLMTLLVIAFALTLPVLLWMVSHNLSRLQVDWRQGGHVVLYLKTGVTAEEANALRDTVANMPGVASVSLKPPGEALAELAGEEGIGDILHYLPENPLPTTMDVTPSLLVDSVAKQDALIAQLKATALVEEVHQDREWVERLHAMLNLLNHFNRALMVLLALVVVLVTGNTLRLLMHARQEFISVLKLIGAPDNYIVRPFLWSGMWFGLAGALMAMLFSTLLLVSLGSAVNAVAMAYSTEFRMEVFSLPEAMLLVVVAGFLGWLGAYLAVKRQIAQTGI